MNWIETDSILKDINIHIAQGDTITERANHNYKVASKQK